MIAAALEASTRAASLALIVEGQVLTQNLADSRAHASDMVPCLAQLCQQAGIHPRQLEVLVLGLGPGSFTGLRVATATALGLARGNGAQLVGLPSHEAMAWNYLESSAQHSEVMVLQDARGGALQYSHYRKANDLPEVLCPPTRIPIEEAAASLPRGIPLLTDAAGLLAAGLDQDEETEVVGGIKPEAASLLQLGLKHLQRNGATAPEELRPLYLAAFTPKARAR
jgi:tRNA threonylcarbamoyladenosine biosynthesis protein TsaB